MNLFQRDARHLTLTPGERAFLKLLEGFSIAGFVAAVTIVAQLLGLPGVDWLLVLKVAAGAFAVGFLGAIAKYYKAQGDPVLSDVATQMAHTAAGYIPPLPRVVNSAASLAPTAPMPAAPATVPSVPQ